MKDRTEPYNLGDNEIHLAFEADDFEAAHALHTEMGCICYENKEMGIYLFKTRMAIGWKFFRSEADMRKTFVPVII